MRNRISAVILIFGLCILCLSTTSNANQEGGAVKLTIPGLKTDTIVTKLSDDSLGKIKRTVIIRLSGKMNESDLKQVAHFIKTSDTKSHEKTFISYYLPGWDLEDIAWATTHFNPDLTVKILGLSSDSEASLKIGSTKAGVESLGVWLDETPYAGCRITIYKKSSKYYLERKYEDGSSGEEEVLKKQTPEGIRFDPLESNWAEDHWLIGKDGNLQIRDSEGLIATARKLGSK